MIGASVITRGGLFQGFRFAKEANCTAIQLYVAPSRTWNAPPLSAADIQAFHHSYNQSNIQAVVAHASLLINLASPRIDVREKSVKRLILEARRCHQLGIKSLIFHPGSNPDRNDGLRLIIENLNTCELKTEGVQFLLETAAGQGSSIGYCFEDLRHIIGELNDSRRFGICFDTCHVFAAGYELRGYEGYARTMDEFDKVVGTSYIKAFHINDSKCDLGSRVDRHAEMIGKSFIGTQTFHALLTDRRFLRCPMIAEVPDTERLTKINVAILHELRLRVKSYSSGSGRGQLGIW